MLPDGLGIHLRLRQGTDAGRKSVKYFAEQYSKLNNRGNKENAFSIFMDKMNVAEKSVQEHGYYSEEEVEKELDNI